MNLLKHLILMAEYNQRMNTQFSDVIDQLSDQVINQEVGAYFGSILGTLNHIIVGDIIWLSRFSVHANNYLTLKSVLDMPRSHRLNDVIFSDFNSFKVAREKIDVVILNWLKNEACADDFTESLQYTNTKGVISHRNFGELVCHLFNHQTHHRGQLSTLLNQQGVDVGITDFLLEIPEE